MRTALPLAAALVILAAGMALAGNDVAGDGAGGERYVTFAFDDAYRSQGDASEQLEQRGWRGVFYVPGGLLNGTFEGYPLLSTVAVQGLAAAGHAVGGITYRHSNLSTLTAVEAERSLEQNRAALRRLGVDPFSFAYPYGVVAHVDVVGRFYPVARAGWGVNTAPPEDPLRVRTISLTEGNAHILDDYLARLDEGEWLVITLHRIDRDGRVERRHVDVSGATYEHILDTVEEADVTVVTPEGAPWNG